jgi:LCP family protein required for cell wall assembly
MSDHFRLDSSSPPRKRRIGARRLAAVVTAVYAVAILGFALFSGARVHDWARQRIVQTSILAELTDAPAAAPAATGVAVAPAADASSPVASDAPVQTIAEVVAEPEPVQLLSILLLGTDERPDEYGPTRTDTMILLTVNPETGAMGMLSLPRDLWVPIPSLGVTTKINTAYMLGELQSYPGGGAQLAKDTVSSFVGRPVDYFVRVNFDGFREIIDLIGGVTVEVPNTIHDEEYPTQDYGVETFHLDAGTHHLDGETALKYARTRHNDGDYSRARRQQDIIRAVAQQVMNAGMIPQLLAKAPQLLATMQSSIETDIPVAVGIELAQGFQDRTGGDVQQLVLDNRYGEETFSSEGAWILLPDRTRVRTALNAFFAAIEAPGGAQQVALADPKAVRIEILNGTTSPGAAARTAKLLQQQGWQVTAIGDADRSDYTQSIVINYGVADAVAAAVSTDLRLVPAQAQINGLAASAPIDIRIVVGRDMLGILQ